MNGARVRIELVADTSSFHRAVDRAFLALILHRFRHWAELRRWQA